MKSASPVRPGPLPDPPATPFADLPVALSHDWLLGMRGGEWVLESLLKLFPRAVIHTLFYRPDAVSARINRQVIRPSILNRLPGVPRYYRWLLPAMPWAVERQRIDPAARLALATSHCVAHGIRAPAGAAHVNYYFSPMRYLYDQRSLYERHGGWGGWLLRMAAPGLRRWDRRAACRGHHAWAISRFVAQRVARAFDLDARVIYPPVDTEFFHPAAAADRVEEFLLVSAMVPYKRVDVAIRAANELRLPLRVVGSGPLLRAMQSLAGPTVAVEGWVARERLRLLYQTRLGLIFPGEEDFGLAPLEAMACAMPVLALRAGGLTETLAEGRCGAFFEQPNTNALVEAWRRFDPAAYDPAVLRANAERFGEARFLAEVTRAVREALSH